MQIVNITKYPVSNAFFTNSHTDNEPVDSWDDETLITPEDEVSSACVYVCQRVTTSIFVAGNGR